MLKWRWPDIRFRQEELNLIELAATDYQINYLPEECLKDIAAGYRGMLIPDFLENRYRNSKVNVHWPASGVADDGDMRRCSKNNELRSITCFSAVVYGTAVGWWRWLVARLEKGYALDDRIANLGVSDGVRFQYAGMEYSPIFILPGGSCRYGKGVVARFGMSPPRSVCPESGDERKAYDENWLGRS